MTDEMLGHKTSLNKFKKLEIIKTIFSDQNGMNQRINNARKTRNFTNKWELKEQTFKTMNGSKKKSQVKL
jgi:hypothetical protein